MILPPTSQIGHHHKVTNITMSPASLLSDSDNRNHEMLMDVSYRYFDESISPKNVILSIS